MKQDTIITMALIVVGNMAMLFAKEYVSAIFKAHPPDIKKHISFIKKSFLFVLSYMLPIATIIYLMVFYKTVDKWFVLWISLNCLAFMFNIVLDIMKYIKYKQNELLLSTMSNLKEVVSISNSNSETMITLASTVGILIDEVKAIKQRIG